MYKTIKWLGREYLWPEDDQKLLQVNDWTRDVDVALPWIKERGVCIQAGGACGLWPSYLSNIFKTVITFEPHPVNHRCLVLNCRDDTNVIALQAALGTSYGAVTLEQPPSEAHNSGTYYVKPKMPGSIPMLPIDAFGIYQQIDFIALDVEGLETQVLEGAQETIELHLPVIMLEDKELPQMGELGTRKGEAVEWLQQNYQYRVVETVHRDVVLVPPGK